MKARWATKCAKCDTTIQVGEDIKAQYRRLGFDPDTHRPIWQRVPKAYVHAPKCPKVTVRKPPPEVDPVTGELPMRECAPVRREQRSLFSD